ncbi:MAG TPA: DUF4412 domain-containing protein [Longimicrobium sp.]|nr:DUF4412 domain-containing protein [Longimicrobium sp.]
MRTVRSLAVPFAAALLAAAPAAAQDLPPAAELIERFNRVSGVTGLTGEDHGHLVYEMSVMGMTMRMENRWSGGDRLHVRMTTPFGDVAEFGRNGDVFWAVDPDDGPRLLTEEEMQAQRSATSLGANVLSMASIRSAETLERTEVEGVPCYRIKVVDNSGVEAEHCLAVDGGALVSSTLWAAARSGGSTTTILFQDYRDVGRHKVPGRLVIRAQGQEVVTTLTHASAEAQPDSVFDVPPAIRALLDAAPRP